MWKCKHIYLWAQISHFISQVAKANYQRFTLNFIHDPVSTSLWCWTGCLNSARFFTIKWECPYSYCLTKNIWNNLCSHLPLPKPCIFEAKIAMFMWEKKIKNVGVCRRWSGREVSCCWTCTPCKENGNASLMSTRRASWAPGPLTTSQVRASQCQHGHLPQNSEGHRRGRGYISKQSSS